MSTHAYPVHVDATLDGGMSRWLWLVKWLLAIPHYVVLFFLWLAFVVVSVMSFFAILFTGRYPRGLFDFNVGVLRWSWRVSYYAFGTLGTDQYPPFTLADVPEYPAHFDVEYPAQLSRGLVLVKWWLLAIPHYLVVGLFVAGGGLALWWTAGDPRGGPGLIGLLVLIAAIVLIFTGRYPQQIFDFVLGMNRWALRVAAYAGLMTDQYPPFRMDLGGHESAGSTTVSPPPAPTPVGDQATVRRRGWTAGRVVSLILGAVIGLGALGALAAGGAAIWATNTQRDGAGYLTTYPHAFATGSYAITSTSIDLGNPASSIAPRDILGTVRIRITPVDPKQAVFVGVGTQEDVRDYLAGVDHLMLTDWSAAGTRTEVTASGAPPATAPADESIWTANAAGLGTQTLVWQPAGGQWAVVVMNADGAPGVRVTADIGVTVPDLGWIAAGLLTIGVLLLTAAVALIAVPVVRASRRHDPNEEGSP